MIYIEELKHAIIFSTTIYETRGGGGKLKALLLCLFVLLLSASCRQVTVFLPFDKDDISSKAVAAEIASSILGETDWNSIIADGFDSIGVDRVPGISKASLIPADTGMSSSISSFNAALDLISEERSITPSSFVLSITFNDYNRNGVSIAEGNLSFGLRGLSADFDDPSRSSVRYELQEFTADAASIIFNTSEYGKAEISFSSITGSRAENTASGYFDVYYIDGAITGGKASLSVDMTGNSNHRASITVNGIRINAEDISDTVSHVHQYTSYPTGYELRGTTIYAEYSCECGEISEKIYRKGVTLVDSKADAETIDNDMGREGDKATGGEDSVVAVGPEFAQDVLDRVGDNSTVILLNGTYRNQLRIQQSEYQSIVRVAKDDTIPAGTDLEVSVDDYLNKEPYIGRYPYYTRNINSLEIIGENGAVLESGILISNSSSGEDPIGERTPGNYFSDYSIEGISFRNLTFQGSRIFFELQHAESPLSDVTLESCEFIGNETTNISGSITTGVGYGFFINSSIVPENVRIIGCSFSDYYQLVRFQSLINLEVRDSEFSGSGHDSIEIQGSTSNNTGGTYIIADSIFENVGGKAIGRGGFSDASFIITGNEFSNISPDDDEPFLPIILQFGGTGQEQDNISIEFSSNRYEGNAAENVSASSFSGETYIIYAP